MQIVELDIKLPYENRGRVLSRIYEKVRGRIRDLHFFPPTAEGFSEIRMEVLEEDTSRLLSELSRVIKNGRVTLRVFSEV